MKDVNGNDASLEVRTEIANDSSAPCNVTLRTVLETADGKELLRSEQPVALAAGASREIVQPLEAKNVRLWSPDDPYLHFISTEIVQDGKVQDTLRTRFGIRLFEMRGKAGFFVNQKFIGVKLSGVNHHQDYAYVGNALPNSGQWRESKLLWVLGNYARFVRPGMIRIRCRVDPEQSYENGVLASAYKGTGDEIVFVLVNLSRTEQPCSLGTDKTVAVYTTSASTNLGMSRQPASKIRLPARSVVTCVLK